MRRVRVPWCGNVALLLLQRLLVLALLLQLLLGQGPLILSLPVWRRLVVLVYTATHTVRRTNKEEDARESAQGAGKQVGRLRERSGGMTLFTPLPSLE